MSNHDDRFSVVKPKKPEFNDDIVTLPVAGQGVIIFSPESKSSKIEFSAPIRKEYSNTYQYFCFGINESDCNFFASKKTYPELEDLLFSTNKGYDSYPNGPFWLSIDFENRLLKGGYGEPRAELVLFSFNFSKGELKEGNVEPNLHPTEEDDPAISEYRWIKEMSKVQLTNTSKLFAVFKDPITVNAAMAVKDMSQITMWDVSNNMATVPANLPSVCQKLFENVGGVNFNLQSVNKDYNLDENFDFAKAIQYSIDTPGKICYNIIEEKAKREVETGFGDPNMVYLRITMGGNQGESPGIPYVMEIWPSNKYSPIHNHGGSEAVIKVLHGEIDVDLFATLKKASPSTNNLMQAMKEAYKPELFKTCKFKLDEVTYITPWLNQIHQLKNNNPVDACITIQCYGYPENSDVHYEYFDWLDTNKHETGEFFPDSDFSFNEFVRAIYKEYKEVHASNLIMS